MWVYPCEHSACVGQKRVAYPLELECESWNLVPGDKSQVLWGSSKHCSLLRHLSRPSIALKGQQIYFHNGRVYNFNDMIAHVVNF